MMPTQLLLSDLIRDPALRTAFLRAERDTGPAFAVPTPVHPLLNGGEAVEIEAVRRTIETTIDRLIRWLDALDAPFEDREPQGDEDEAVDDLPCDDAGQDMEPDVDDEPDAEAEASGWSEWACGFGPWHDHYSQESGARGTHLALAD